MVGRREGGRGKGRRVVQQSASRRTGRGTTSPRHVGPPSPDTQVLSLGRRNWILLGCGTLAVLAGFSFLAAGDITVAPVLLLAGYLVLIPMGLISGSLADDDATASPVQKSSGSELPTDAL